MFYSSGKREDGAGILRFDIAYGKAWGALGMGFGTRELAERSGVDRYSISPRISELLPLGLVESVGERQRVNAAGRTIREGIYRAVPLVEAQQIHQTRRAQPQQALLQLGT